MQDSTATRSDSATQMRSRTGFYAAIVVLLSVPATILFTNLFWPDGAETLIHLTLGAGFLLFALAVPDFKTGTWTTRVGVAAMAGLAGIFMLQGISESVESSGLHRIAFEILGQGPEAVCMDAFIGWCVVMLVTGSHGKTLTFGTIILFSVVSLEAARLILLAANAGALPEVVKLTSLVAVVWFLLESKKPVAVTHKTEAAADIAPLTVATQVG